MLVEPRPVLNGGFDPQAGCVMQHSRLYQADAAAGPWSV